MPDNFKRSIEPAVPDQVVSQLATLAQIPEPARNQFGTALIGAVVFAHFTNEIHHTPHGPASEVVEFLERVITTARDLDTAIAMFQGVGVGANQRLAAETAGMLLDQAIEVTLSDEYDPSKLASWKIGHRESRALLCLTQSRHLLDLLITSASKTKQKAAELFPRRRGRPPGVGGNPTFDELVKNLREVARKCGGRLTLTRDPYAEKPAWKGTLPKALQILRPYLPKTGFFPPGNLGYALERVSKQFRLDTAKIPRHC
jgi:hypothetical protein